MKHRFTRQAERDILRIFRDSIRLFGEMQARRYFEIINQGVAVLRSEPFRLTSKERSDIGLNVRSLHLQLVAKRSGGASHILHYRLRSMHGDGTELIILRVLGDRMEPARRVRSALRDEDRS